MMSAPWSRSANASRYPWLNLNVAPIASSPDTCMSIGREPKSSPPGSDRRTCPQRVRSGPSTLIEARIRSTSSYGATGTMLPVLTSSSRPGAGRVIVTPMAVSRSPMMATSAMSGTFESWYVPSASRLVAISLRTEFLAPGTVTTPSRGPLPRTTIVSPWCAPATEET